MLDLNIYNEDCLEGMKKIPTGSIDMILCDLPYGTTVNKWDSIIPMNELWTQYKRMIKESGAIILHASQPFTSKLISGNLEMFRYSWIWIKENGTGFVNAHSQPLKIYEDICVFSKSSAVPSARKRMVYNPQGIVPYGKVTRRGSAGSNYNQQTIKNENFQEYTNYPTNVLTYPRDQKKMHPTQKPVALLEYLIKTYTNDCETVLDNCMGSGSTAIAAINTNRNFIGFELDGTYYNLAKERINKHIIDLNMQDTYTLIA